jgi:tetratricopeptide (TPR) repeat protein
MALIHLRRPYRGGVLALPDVWLQLKDGRASLRSMTVTSAAGRIRRRKIQREAEGYLELAMPEQALQALGRLGAPANFNVDALYLWGEALRELQRPFEALVPLERAVRMAPEDIRVRMALGWCYKRTGRLDLAIDSLEHALTVEPDESLLHYNLACYLSLAGQKLRALRYLSQALKTDPVYRELVETESDFDPIRSDPEFQAICAKGEQKDKGPETAVGDA